MGSAPTVPVSVCKRCESVIEVAAASQMTEKACWHIHRDGWSDGGEAGARPSPKLFCYSTRYCSADQMRASPLVDGIDRVGR